MPYTAAKPSATVDASFIKLWLPSEIRCTTGFVNAASSVGGGTALEAITSWVPNDSASGFNDDFVAGSGSSGLPAIGRVGKIPGAAFHTTQLSRPWSMQSDISRPSGSFGTWSSPRTCIWIVRTQGCGNNGVTNSYATKYANTPWETTGSDRAGMGITNCWQESVTQCLLGMTGTRKLAYRINYPGASYSGQAALTFQADIKLGAGFEIIIEKLNDTGGSIFAATTQSLSLGVFRNGAIVWDSMDDTASKKMQVSTQLRIPYGQYDGFQGLFYGGCIFEDDLTDTQIGNMCQWFAEYFGIVEPSRLLTVIGDSRVHGWYSNVDHTFVQSIAAVLEPQGVKVTEYGYPGVTAEAMAGTTANIVDAAAPSLICLGHNITQKVALLHIGINDIAGATLADAAAANALAATIYANYGTIADALRGAGYSKVGLLGEYTYAAGSLLKETARQTLRDLCIADASSKLDFYIDMERACPALCADELGGATTDAAIANTGGGYGFQRIDDAAADRLLTGAYTQNSVDCGSDGIHLGPVGQSMLGAAVAQSVELVGDNGLGLVQTGLRPRVRGGGVR